MSYLFLIVCRICKCRISKNPHNKKISNEKKKNTNQFTVPRKLTQKSLTNSPDNNPQHNYNLFATIHHHGQTDTSGHYTLKLYDVNKKTWILIDGKDIKQEALEHNNTAEKLDSHYIIIYAQNPAEHSQAKIPRRKQ